MLAPHALRSCIRIGEVKGASPPPSRVMNLISGCFVLSYLRVDLVRLRKNRREGEFSCSKPIERIELLRSTLRFRMPLEDGAHELEVMR